MSTKTTFKRVAAVAAAALAISGFSAVSAHAGAGQIISTTSGSSIGTIGAGLNLTSNDVVASYSSESVTSAATDHVYTITSTGVGTLSIASPAAGGYTAAATGAGIGGAILANPSTSVIQNYIVNSTTAATWYAGVTPGLTAFGNASVFGFAAYSATAGTQTITVVGDVTGTVTHTITWGAAPALNAANSYVVPTNVATLANSATATSAQNSDAVLARMHTTVAAGDSSGFTQPINTGQLAIGGLYVSLMDNQQVTQALTTDKIEVKITSGPGLLAVTPGTSHTSTLTTDYVASSPGSNAYALLLSDGRAGTTVITAYDYTTSTVIGSATFISAGTTPASLKFVAQGRYVAGAGANLPTTAPTNVYKSGAVTLKVLDSNGYPVTQVSGISGSATASGFWATSDNTACMKSSVVAVLEGDSTTSTSTVTYNSVGTYEVQLLGASGAASGCTANVTVKYTIPTTLTVLALDPIKFTVGGTSIGALALTTDADSYAPGSLVTFTMTAKDSKGNPIADGKYGIFYNNTNPVDTTMTTGDSALSSNLSLTSIPFSIGSSATATEAFSFKNGIATSSAYAPYVDGTVTLDGTLAASNNGIATFGSGLLPNLYNGDLTVSFGVNTASSTSSQAAIDAAQEATDAANAVYDAANNAMDSADAATAAVQDASDNASAALAAVTSLSATVAKLVKSVAAIAAALAKVQKKIGA